MMGGKWREGTGEIPGNSSSIPIRLPSRSCLFSAGIINAALWCQGRVTALCLALYIRNMQPDEHLNETDDSRSFPNTFYFFNKERNDPVLVEHFL